jgi:hypothetical protein
MAKEVQKIKAAPSKIVSAVGAAAKVVGNASLGKEIEAAMSAAALKAQASGETDPNKIRAAMLTARDEVKAKYART